eukprot:4954407-Pyramimonas_sp.AAC.1
MLRGLGIGRGHRCGGPSPSVCAIGAAPSDGPRGAVRYAMGGLLFGAGPDRSEGPRLMVH